MQVAPQNIIASFSFYTEIPREFHFDIRWDIPVDRELAMIIEHMGCFWIEQRCLVRTKTIHPSFEGTLHDGSILPDVDGQGLPVGDISPIFRSDHVDRMTKHLHFARIIVIAIECDNLGIVSRVCTLSI